MTTTPADTRPRTLLRPDEPKEKGRDPVIPIIVGAAFALANDSALTGGHLRFLGPALVFWLMLLFPAYLLATTDLWGKGSVAERLSLGLVGALLLLLVGGLAINTVLPLLGVARPVGHGSRPPPGRRHRRRPLVRPAQTARTIWDADRARPPGRARDPRAHCVRRLRTAHGFRGQPAEQRQRGRAHHGGPGRRTPCSPAPAAVGRPAPGRRHKRCHLPALGRHAPDDLVTRLVDHGPRHPAGIPRLPAHSGAGQVGHVHVP